MGRVVMSGAKTEYLQSMGLRRDQCPIINVEPNILQIESALSDILMCPHQIAERGKQSRLFVEEHYNAEKVANKFLDVWRRSL
jgi:hypothetical protein